MDNYNTGLTKGKFFRIKITKSVIVINFFIGFQPSVTYCIVLYWVVLFEKKLKRENKEAQCFRKQTVGFSEKGQCASVSVIWAPKGLWLSR